jgi:hypothetical protein
MLDEKGNPVLKLTAEGSNALIHCLKSGNPKGYEVRLSGKILKAAAVLTLKEKKGVPGHGEMWVEMVKAGNLTLGVDQFKYLKLEVVKRMDVSVPGSYSVGYTDLIEEIEETDKTLKEKEKATP